MKTCPGCPQIPEAKHCQSCYFAEKARRMRLEKNLAKLLYQIDRLIAAAKGI